MRRVLLDWKFHIAGCQRLSWTNKKFYVVSEQVFGGAERK